MKQRLSLITLGVRDLQRAVNFYKSGLGWKESSVSQGDVYFFSMGGVILSLYPRDMLAKDAQVESEGTGFSGITLAYNTETKEEVDEILKKVEKIGAKVIKKAEMVFWGGYSGYFADPDGHLWEVAWNPFFEMDNEGKVLLP